MNFDGKHIWIIGASSGIGRQLAVELANQGASLILSARRESELVKLQSELKGQHQCIPLDVSDYRQVKESVDSIHCPIDSVIFMAAIYQPGTIKDMKIDAAQQTINVNINGALHVINSCMPVFEKQQHGQFALCASVAGYLGLPNSGQPYSATKAAIINIAQTLAAECENYIDVKLICPGFVETPMTSQNDFTMPMIISAEKAATIIADGLAKPGFEIAFPKRTTWFLKCLSMLPYRLQLAITRRITT